jgi:hypothetical protein
MLLKLKQSNSHLREYYSLCSLLPRATSRPRCSSGYRACHWTQGSRIQNRPKPMDFKGDKNQYHDFIRRGSSKDVCPMS